MQTERRRDTPRLGEVDHLRRSSAGERHGARTNDGRSQSQRTGGHGLEEVGRTQRRNRGWHPPELRLLGSKARTEIHDRTDEECIRITRQTVGDVMRGIIADAGTRRARRIANRDQRDAHMNRERMWGTEGAGHQRTENAESRSRGGNTRTVGESESMAGRTIN